MKHVHFYCLSLYEEHIKTKAIRNEIYIHRSKLIYHEFYKNQEPKPKNRNILKTTILKNNILNKNIELEWATNPDIIAGLVFEVGDNIIDNSLRHKLQDLSRNIMK